VVIWLIQYPDKYGTAHLLCYWAPKEPFEASLKQQCVTCILTFDLLRQALERRSTQEDRPQDFGENRIGWPHLATPSQHG